MPGQAHVIHTERGHVEVSGLELALYRALAAERFRVFTKHELCSALGDISPRQLDATAATLRHKIRERTGLRLVANVWGVGFRLEVAPAPTEVEICRHCGYRADQHRYDGACPTCDEDAAYYHEHDN